MSYKCIETFKFPNFCYEMDESKEQYVTVEAGSIWEVSDNNYIGGDIHLENHNDDLYWIEITFDDFNKYFKEIK